MNASSSRHIVRVDSEGRNERSDLLPTEEPVEFRLAGVPIAVLMRTPGHDAELARGFALTEGIIFRPSELADVRELPGEDGAGRYELVTADGIDIDPEQFRRNLYSTSSCGVCGKASIDAVRVAAPRLPDGPVVPAQALSGYMDVMREAQSGFSESGGLHAAAAFSVTGEMLALPRGRGPAQRDGQVGRLPLSEAVATRGADDHGLWASLVRAGAKERRWRA